MELSSRQAFVVVLVVGVVGTGLVQRGFAAAGYPGLGTAFWIVGYATTVLALWYGWVRPLDLTGPTDRSRADDESDPD
jgi:hypothetical protein